MRSPTPTPMPRSQTGRPSFVVCRMYAAAARAPENPNRHRQAWCQSELSERRWGPDEIRALPGAKHAALTRTTEVLTYRTQASEAAGICVGHKIMFEASAGSTTIRAGTATISTVADHVAASRYVDS
jgi:hypothetical protein